MLKPVALALLLAWQLEPNDVSSFRIDHMPYGGVKDSGLK
jgi:hypothetical protein